MKSKGKTSRDREAVAALLSDFFFDWFQFTIPAAGGGAMCRVGGQDERAALGNVLAWATGEGLHPGRTRGGANGYRVGLPLLDGPEGEPVAVLSSGSAMGIMPNLCITGGQGAAAFLAVSAQAAFPGLRLSRADAALDRSAPGLWDALHEMALKLAKGNPKLGGVRVIQSEQGRTFYLGSPSSTVSLRVYEKDRERLARGVIDAADCDPDLTRIEWTFRPQSQSKVGVGVLSPGEMIRTSVWARDFMSRAAVVLGDAERVVKIDRQTVEREARPSCLEASADYGAHQYGGVFTRLAVARIVQERHGGDYAGAVLTSAEVEDRAASLFRLAIGRICAGQRTVEREGVDRSETVEERNNRIVSGMIAGAIRLTEDRADAVGVTRHALDTAGETVAAAAAAAAQARLRAVATAERVAA